ncbi:MAG TPA: phosphoribosylamine--glycine ligase [Erysipelotrichaceae bacterium]|nr:phosphoribosylamine--glycine ligase [Erysipelotrichaceae bacterium]
MGNKILVIGSGGREHALATCFAKSPTVEKVYVAPGSHGMKDVAEIVAIDAMDFPSLIAFIKSNQIDLVFVGPEAPLSQGIVDVLSKEGIRIFGPTQAAARLESSKSYAKTIMNKYDIPTAKHSTVHSLDEALTYLNQHPAPIVIKADGLMAGKGVTVAIDDETARQAVHDIYPDPTVHCPLVIEECLIGEEFSLMAFVDGENVFPLDIAKDHKRAYDNDEGPNTGGMGAYSPVPSISREMVEEAMDRVMRPIAKAMVKEGNPFTGILYGGLMATSDGIKTIEFNVRFGDPETEVLLPRLITPLDQVVLDVLDHKHVTLEFDPRFALGVVLASKGYPHAYEKGLPIEGLDKVDANLFHMGTSYADGYRNQGGRVLFVMNYGVTLEKARESVYKEITSIHAPHCFYRTDIGKTQGDLQ